MAQLFAPGADALLRLAILSGAALLAGGAVVVAGLARSDYVTGVGTAPAQPVPFSHKHHSGELGIDCRYCHTTVETQATAGLPPDPDLHDLPFADLDRLGHAETRARQLRDERALRWTRLNKLPQYVYYNHSVHVTKGIGCSTCHGDVTTMQMTFRANAFEMRFCLDCHRAPERYVRTPDQVWNMNWSPPADQATLGRELVAKHHIRGGDRLTECGICHR